MDQRRARGALLLGALVALDAAVVAVLGLALLPGDLDTVDAAVARIQQLEVIDHAAGDSRATGRIRADPVGVDGNELLLRLSHCLGREPGCRDEHYRQCRFHRTPPPQDAVRKLSGSIALSMREGPQTELFLGDLPKACEAMRLDDEEEDDQPAEDDGLEV